MTELFDRFIAFSKPFVEGAKNVFETMVFAKIEAQKPTLKKNQTSLGDVSAIMGLTGTIEIEGNTLDFKGMMVLSFPFGTYIKIASAMLMDEYTEFTDEIADVGAEISNIVTGNAKRDLKGLGYNIDMAVPTTISGSQHRIKYPEKTHVIVIPMKCEHGDFFMELCYQDS